MTSDLAQLEQAMTALEAQRSLLGDAVVDAALAPMRDKLAALRASHAPAEQRKHGHDDDRHQQLDQRETPNAPTPFIAAPSKPLVGQRPVQWWSVGAHVQ